MKRNRTSSSTAGPDAARGRQIVGFLRSTRFTLLAALSVCGSLSVSGNATASDWAAEPAMLPCPTARMELSGTVNDYTQAVVENWLLRAPRDNPAMLEMFADRDERPHRELLPWSGEFAGKYLTCLVQVLRLSGDPRLEELGEDFVGKLVALQADDGYLGPFPKESRLTGKKPNGKRTWDAWGHYHVMLGLLLWHDQTGDDAALECASRIGDLFCDKFLGTDKQVSSMGSAEMNQAVVHSLALLYNRTGEQKYLDLANDIVLDFAAPNAGNYLQAGLEGLEFFEIPKPRWESLHSLMGLAELYWNTGKRDYRDVFEHYWWSIVELDRHNNGGFSSGEQAHGDPYHQGPIETCCTVAWMAMSVEMLKMTGDSRVADELELSTLNQAVGTYSPDGMWSTYNTPMDGRRVPSTVDIAFQIRPGSEELNCCSVNAARMFGMISDWAVMREDDGLVLNWYGPSEFEEQLGDAKVSLRQETDYPRDGAVKLHVDPDEPTEFTLKLRIPHWSKNTKVAVNGDPVEASPGSYLAIDRRWRAGDVVTLEIDESIRCWVGENECEGKAALYRGPLLMAYREPSAAKVNYGEAWNAYGHFRAASEASAKVECVFYGDSLEWRGFYMDDAGKARITIDGEAVEVVDQYGPKRNKPFVRKFNGLGAGKHVATIEVLAEHHAKSKGVWVNIQDLKTSADIPTLGPETIRQPSSIIAVADGFLECSLPGEGRAPVKLRDFATVGLGGATYSSWLPAEGIPATPFSRDNPSRTSVVSP
ncbi:beta-L-arabinofuranosidase domain-containing protein [Pseudobythopirellula maris]|nr:beta-L-arabinofuranosidase domain-containing protein [Pseudobythopirellula maris]